MPEKLTDGRKTGADFLLADLDTAFTFMDVGAVSDSQETRKRNHAKAYHAYRTVLRLLDTVTLEAAQRAAIEHKLTLLRERLEKVGYRSYPRTG
jgi:hypothetical protein